MIQIILEFFFQPLGHGYSALITAGMTGYSLKQIFTTD
jgi:hypothetical protein